MSKASLTLVGVGLALAGASALPAAELATILLPQDQEIQMALEAGPEHLRAAATVYVFGADGYLGRSDSFSGLQMLELRLETTTSRAAIEHVLQARPAKEAHHV